MAPCEFICKINRLPEPNNVQNKIHICEECIGEAITLAPTRSWKEKQSRNP